MGTLNIKNFLEPFDSYFTYGSYILNLKHNITQDLIRILSSISLIKKQKDYNKEQIGRIEDSISNFFEIIGSGGITLDMINNSLNGLIDLAQKILFLKVNNSILSFKDFIPGSIYMWNGIVYKKQIGSGELKFRNFGKPITQIS